MMNNATKRGFTLIELLISMSIFMIFLGVVMNSYFGIVRTQQDVNEYRIMYSEARHVFDRVVDDARNSAFYVKDSEDVVFLLNDGMTARRYDVDEVGKIVVKEAKVNNGLYIFDSLNDVFLNSDEVMVKDFEIRKIEEGRLYDDFTHPRVKISATFVRELSETKSFEFDLQTTISSRYYGEIPNITIL